MVNGRQCLLLNENFTADGAMFALRQARLCASGRNRFINDNGMPVRSNLFRIATAAPRTSISTHAFFCARRLLCHFARVGMLRHRDNFLLDEYGVADGAMLSLRQTRLCAGWFDRCIDHFRMRNHRDNFLLDEHGAADGAMLSFGQTRFCTSGCDCCIDHFRMRNHRDNFLLDEHGVADRTMLSFGQSCLRARGRDRFVDHFRMRSHRNALRIAAAAY